MKRICLYTALLATMSWSMGCKKYLEQLPDQRTELNSPEKVSELLVSAYPKSNYAQICESMSDNVGENIGATTYDVINTNMFFWEDNVSTSQDAPSYYWNACYSAIAAANQALDAIGKAANKDSYKAQQGEALLCRAYAHFMLVTLFAKPYDPATSAADPGIPYVDKPETVVYGNYERKTVQYVYDRIDADIQEGITLIDDRDYTSPRFHFNKAASNAFACRFYLFKQDYDKSIQYASAAFPNESFVSNMRPWLTAYAALSSTELGIQYLRSSESANLLLSETTSWWARRFTAQRYSTTSDIISRVLDKGGYANITGGQTAYNYWYATTSQIYYIRKLSEHFVRTTLNANTGVGYVMFPLFTTEEVLLNRAEAYNAKGDFGNALKDINLFFSQRILSYNTSLHTVTEAKAKTFYDTDDTQEAILLTILDAKRAEFLHEGMRWFDILRHKLPVTHKLGSGQTIELGADDPRKILQLPAEASYLGLNPR